MMPSPMNLVTYTPLVSALASVTAISLSCKSLPRKRTFRKDSRCVCLTCGRLNKTASVPGGQNASSLTCCAACELPSGASKCAPVKMMDVWQHKCTKSAFRFIRNLVATLDTSRTAERFFHHLRSKTAGTRNKIHQQQHAWRTKEMPAETENCCPDTNTTNTYIMHATAMATRISLSGLSELSAFPFKTAKQEAGPITMI